LSDPRNNTPTSTVPWIEARPISGRVRVRSWAALVLAGCLGVLGIAAYLEPNPRGYGTHERLGVGPCGMLVMTGLPCPTCGMTTAFAHTVRLQWWRAFYAQPAGFVLALGTIGMAGVAVWTLFRGRWPRPNLGFLTPYRLFIGLLVLLMGGWVFKIVVGLADKTLPYR
jgi:hypothetical protein